MNHAIRLCETCDYIILYCLAPRPKTSQDDEMRHFAFPDVQVHRFPHIVYFTSLTEMIHLVQTLDLNAVSLRMQASSGQFPMDW